MKQNSTLRSFLLACSSLLAVSPLHADTLTWDPAGGGTSDGTGTWLAAGKWWNGANVDWNNAPPDNAVIGNGGAGGTITVGAVTAGSVLIDNFTGTYTLSSGTLTQSGGFTVGSSAGNVTLTNPTLTGTGGLTMNGPGILSTQGSTLSYSGTTNVTNGTLQLHNNKPSGNFTLNNGLLNDYYRNTTLFTLGLGSGANQIQMSGVSGFGAGNGSSTWRIGGSLSILKWGTAFNPTVLQLQTPASNMGPTIYGQVTLDNGLDLNGGARTIHVLGTGVSPASSTGTIKGAITDTGSGGGLTKTGNGLLLLPVNNTYTGPTIIDGGVVQFGTAFGSAGALPGGGTGSGSNLEIKNGNARLAYYMKRPLGTGPGDVQITGGTSGFSHTQADTYGRITVANNAAYEVVWGDPYFKPDVFVLNDDAAKPDQIVNFQNKLDLNGADRTVAANATSLVSSNYVNANNYFLATNAGVISGDIRNSQGTAAGLIKTGPGLLLLVGTNTYDGGSTINGGTLGFGSITTMPASGTVTVNGGATLGVNLGGDGEWTTGTSGNGTLGGLLAGDGGQSGSTVSYVGNVALTLRVSGSQTFSVVVGDVGTSLSLSTDGSGTLELSGDNTLSGDFIMDGGSTLILSGDNSGAGGAATIINGYLQAGLANLPTGGGVTFSSPGNNPAILVSSGSLAPTIGSANDVYWSANGGFAASSSALTVTVNAGANLVWNNGTTGFNGKILQLGSPFSTAPVTITNNITINNNYTIRLFDNSATSSDVSILSGNVVRDGANNRNLTVEGSGTLALSGANNFGNGILYVGNSGGSSVVRATDGVGLPTAAKLYFNNGVLESSGTFSRSIGTANSQVYWNSKGGFAANGGALTVNLGGAGAAVNWGGNPVGFRAQDPLYFGSPTADNVVTFENGIILDNNRNIQVTDNPYSENDYAVITGVISQSGTRSLDKEGDGTLVFEGANTYTGITTINGGTLIINGTQTSATGLVDVKSGKTLGGSGTIGGNVTVENTAGLTFDFSTAAGSHDKLDVIGSFTFESGSVLTITSSSGASPGTYTLVTAGSATTGSVPATVNLPAGWTADAPQIVGNDLVINITSTGSAASPYDTWADTFLADDVSDPALNFDNDSLTNLQEFAFGTDPTVSTGGSITYAVGGEVSATGLPVAVNLADPGVDFRAVFGRRKDYVAAGLTYTVQFSAGLDVWVNSGDTPTEVSSSTTGDIEAVSVPYPLFINTVNGMEKPTFFRVGVLQAP
jgi:autotransporter-associated beta strand protein